MSKLFVILLIAHLLSDFYFQSDNSCRNRNPFRGKSLLGHVACTFLTSFGLLAVSNATFHNLGRSAFCALLIAFSHYIIDSIKIIVSKRINTNDTSKGPLIIFCIDQILHLSIILLISYYALHWWTSPVWLNFLLCKQSFAAALSMLICAKPANVFIRQVLNSCNIKTEQSDIEDLTNCNDSTESINGKSVNGRKNGLILSTRDVHAGQLIGTLERWLIVIFIFLNQYEAIGLLVAAKSILRFHEANEPEKSEYVLAGTLLSYTIVVIVSLVCQICI